MVLMPIVESRQNVKAINELQQIKKIKKEKEMMEEIKLKTTLRKKSIIQSKLKEDLLKRRVEIGVP